MTGKIIKAVGPGKAAPPIRERVFLEQLDEGIHMSMSMATHMPKDIRMPMGIMQIIGACDTPRLVDGGVINLTSTEIQKNFDTFACQDMSRDKLPSGACLLIERSDGKKLPGYVAAYIAEPRHECAYVHVDWDPGLLGQKGTWRGEKDVVHSVPAHETGSWIKLTKDSELTLHVDKNHARHTTAIPFRDITAGQHLLLKVRYCLDLPRLHPDLMRREASLLGVKEYDPGHTKWRNDATAINATIGEHMVPVTIVREGLNKSTNHALVR